MKNLQGKTAVVTGGSRGLGYAIAREMAQQGAQVVIAARSPSSLEEAVRQLRAEGLTVFGLPTDVCDLSQVEALAAYAVQTTGKIDVWVNNAGTAGPYGPTTGFSAEAFEQVTRTNTLGVFYGARTALKYFTAQKSGKLINMLGHGYQGPVAWQNAYSASKAWVRSFSMALAEETRGSGVGIYAFNPGMVLTELLTDVEVIQGSEGRLKSFPTIVRMWAKPPEVPARKAAWLASAATDGKTGLLVSIFSPWVMLGGAIQEGLRRLLRRPTADSTVKLRSIPPAAK
jgi:NAD(P)-dependent dehydrogenase (short-subunit alcohol dehydrogenase family)